MWNTISAEGTVTRTCMFGGFGASECDIVENTDFTRQCNADGEWEEPDLYRCFSNATRRICEIRNVSIIIIIHCVVYSFTWERSLNTCTCFALFVCLTLLASFFLPSHLSFKNMYVCLHTLRIIIMYTCGINFIVHIIFVKYI